MTIRSVFFAALLRKTVATKAQRHEAKKCVAFFFCALVTLSEGLLWSGYSIFVKNCTQLIGEVSTSLQQVIEIFSHFSSWSGGMFCILPF